jgi:hypothetical protein
VFQLFRSLKRPASGETLQTVARTSAAICSDIDFGQRPYGVDGSTSGG